MTKTTKTTKMTKPTKEQEKLTYLRDIFNEQERLSSPHGRIEKDSGGKNETWKLFLASYLEDCSDNRITQKFLEKYQWEFWPDDMPIPTAIEDLPKEDQAKLKAMKQKFNEPTPEPTPEPKKKRKYTKRTKKKKVEIEETKETEETEETKETD